MDKIKNLIKKDVLDFIELVANKSRGYDIYLGGGYLRDTYYQTVKNKDIITTKPKDIDLFFIPKQNENVFELPTIPHTYINYNIDARDIPNVRENVKHVRGLFKSDLSTKDIQFIIYDKPMTMEFLAEDMDCNINQIMYSIKDQVGYATNNFYNGFEDDLILMLHTFDTERMFGRVQRMMKKFPTFTVEHNIPVLEWERLSYEMEVDKLSGKRKRVRANGSFIGDEMCDF